jgi:hypothetical protein
MRRAILLAIALGLLLASTAIGLEPGDTLWTRTYGGTGYDVCNSIQRSTGGGFIFAGQNGSQGGIYPWLFKTDANGDSLWAVLYVEATTNTLFGSVQETADGGYVAGGQSRQNWGVSRIDYYLAKTDSIGNSLWTSTYSTPGLQWDYGKSARQTMDGGYIFGGDTAPGPRPYDFYLVRTDASGDTVWTRTYGDTGNYDDRCNSVAVTSDGCFVMAGYTNGHGAGGWNFYLVKVAPDGDTVWTRTYGGSAGEEAFCVQETSDRGFVLAGYTSSFGAGNQDFYVVRTDSTGNSLWQRTYGGSDHDYANCVRETPDGGFIIVGSTASFGAGFTDCYIVRTDALGDTVWTRAYGGYDDERAHSVDLTSDGGCIVGGHTTSWGSGSHDVWLLRLAGEQPSVYMECQPLSPIICRGKNFFFKLIIDNSTGENVSGILTFTGYAAHDCQPGNELVAIPRNKSYPPGTTEEPYFFKVPSAAAPGPYSASVASTLSGHDLYCCMNTDIVQCYPWRAGDNSTWELVEGGRMQVALPTTVELHHNHPNPFNSYTVISYELSTDAHVKLEVYNVTGEKVTTLLNGVEEAGHKSVTWDACEVSSGLYFYRLTAGDFTETKRMMLVK